MPDFTEAVAESRRSALVALRDRLAGECVEASARDLPPLVRQLREVLRDIDSIPVPGEANPIDEIAKRRRSRRSRPTG